MIDNEQIIENLRLLADLIEEGKVKVEGQAIRKKFDKPDFADFDSEPKLEDTGKRTLTIEFIE